jgi:hypothetical protein
LGGQFSAGTISYTTGDPIIFRANSTGSINLTNGSNSTFAGNILSGITTISNATFNTHSIKDELLETVVKDETIEMIYKSTITPNYWISGGLSYIPPQPEIKIYKNVYSRFDGSVRRVEGTYIPPVSSGETYEF